MNFLDFLATGGFAITPSNDVLTETAQGMRVGGPGILIFETEDGDSLTIDVAYAGEPIYFKIKKVLPGTTASNLIGYRKLNGNTV